MDLSLDLRDDLHYVPSHSPKDIHGFFDDAMSGVAADLVADAEAQRIGELFLERASGLYNDILDALSDDPEHIPTPRLPSEELWERHRKLLSQAEAIRGRLPLLSSAVGFRMSSVERALESLEQRLPSAPSGGGTGVGQLRRWLQGREEALEAADLTSPRLRKAQLPVLTDLLHTHKTLQSEIEREGGALVSAVQRHFAGPESSSGRRGVVVGWLERRWHGLWLRSLEAQCRLEHQIAAKAQEAAELSESEPEVGEPLNKRPRHMDASELARDDGLVTTEGTALRASAEDPPVVEIVPPDVGYSSGENSVHEGQGSPATTPTTTPSSPLKSYYKMTPLDDMGATDTETPREEPSVFGRGGWAELLRDDAASESLVALPASDIEAQRDMQDVLSLLDDEPLDRSNDGSLLSRDIERLGGTTWKSIRGRAARDTESEASGEASSRPASPPSPALTPPPNSPLGASTPCDGSLKRRRRRPRPMGHSTSDGAVMSMSASAAALPSLLWASPGLMTASLHRETRKKLRVRRLPRSMSDGEQLGFGLPCLLDDSDESESERPRRIPHSFTGFASMGGGEGLVERAEGDGGESEAGGGGGCWEWDDYKPPHHDESGPMEESLDASRLGSFGDDYGLAGLPSSYHPSDPVHPLGSRPTPLGDSESEAEELASLLRRSRTQLERSQAALGRRCPLGDAQGDLVTTAETNLRCLSSLCGHLRALGAQARAADHAAASRLHKDWQDLLFRLASSGAKATATEDFGQGLLQAEVRRLASSLEELIQKGSLNQSFASGCYATQAELADAIELLQGLHSRLGEERERLRLLSASMRSLSPAPSDPSEELGGLCGGCEAALASCAHQLSDLARMQDAWRDWDATRPLVDKLLAKLDASLGELELKAAHPGAVANAAAALSTLESVESQVSLCSERLSRLESLCGCLDPTGGFGAQLAELSTKLDGLKGRVAELPQPRRRRSPLRTEAEAPTPPRTRLRRRRGWGLAVAALLLLCLGAALFSGVPSDRANNWAWAWGPKLDYVHGRPPPV